MKRTWTPFTSNALLFPPYTPTLSSAERRVLAKLSGELTRRVDTFHREELSTLHRLTFRGLASGDKTVRWITGRGARALPEVFG